MVDCLRCCWSWFITDDVLFGRSLLPLGKWTLEIEREREKWSYLYQNNTAAIDFHILVKQSLGFEIYF